MGIGAAGFAEGFQRGLATTSAIRQRDAQIDIQQAEEARAKEAFERKKAIDDQNRADGDELAKATASFLGAQPQMGVRAPQAQPQPMGPPAPDGSMDAPVAPQPGAEQTQGAQQPTSYVESLKQSQAYMAQIAPIMQRIYARNDPVKGAEFASKIGDVKVQQNIAQKVAVGKLLLSNPQSDEARDAFVAMYKDNGSGQIDPASYQVLGNGSVKFNVVGKDGASQPQVVTPGQIRGMVMQGMTPQQLIAQLVEGDKNSELARYHDAQIKNLDADNKRGDEQMRLNYGLHTAQLNSLNEERAARREDREAAREDRKESKARAEKDDIMRGIDNVLIGDSKTFADRPPEEKQTALGLRGDTVNLIEMNPDAFKGKGSSVGARALSVTNAILNRKAKIEQDDSQPDTVIVTVGGAKYKLPFQSYAVQSILRKKQ